MARPDEPPAQKEQRRERNRPERTARNDHERARDLFEQRRPEMAALHEQMRENRALLRESLESGSPNPTDVGELVIEGHALRQKGRALREESKEAFEGLLTPYQKR